MPLGALLLALGAAGLHAGWNVLLARERDTAATSAVALTVFVLSLAPLAAFTWRVDGDAWPFIVASGLLELAYIVLLAAGYARYDVSVVYPLARGLAPVAALGISLGIVGASASPAEITGVLVVAGGILLVRGARGGRGGALALLIGAIIGGYTVVDRYGIRHASAAAYLMLVMLLPALAYPLIVRDAARLRRAIGPTAVVVGVASAAAYLLVLLALRRAPAASVAAVRETSVVIAVVLAGVVLHEPVGRRRLVGSAIVAAGVALLALG